MHQVLRFLYVDQETGSTKIFRAEDNPRGDSEGIRTAIAEFLLGLDNLDTHKLRQQLILAEREFDRVAADLNAMYKVLGSDSGLTLDVLNAQVINISDEIVCLQNKDVELKTTTEFEVESAFNYKELEKKVDLFSRKLQSLNIEIQATTGEIVDCELFGDSLDFRKKSLLESKSAFDCIGAMKYTHCPCCLEEINSSNEDTCHLCNTPNKESHHSNNYMQILTELDFQIKSNAKVLGDYKSHLEGLKSALVISESQLKTSQSELQSSSKTVDIETQSLIKRSKKIGYLESEIKNIEKQVKIITDLDQYKSRKSELNTEGSPHKSAIA
jgi:chromosome segregation ATPase